MEEILIRLETKGRAGKKVTIIEGFTRHFVELEELAQTIKIRCGSGGTVKGNRMQFQGDQQKSIALFLGKMGFKLQKFKLPNNL